VQSDAGIALDAGTDIAMESAGVVLVSDKLDKVASAIVLGCASRRKMKHNIAIAVTANVVGITLAILGVMTAPLAIAIMAVSVLAVPASTLLLVRLEIDVAATEDATSAADVAETVIPARRMHCDACSRRIRRKLSTLDGVRGVEPDAIRKAVFVAYEPARVSEDRLRQELEAPGLR
jgi:Cu+-exporting ATPase